MVLIHAALRLMRVADSAHGAVLRSACDRAHSGRVCQEGVNTVKGDFLYARRFHEDPALIG